MKKIRKTKRLGYLFMATMLLVLTIGVTGIQTFAAGETWKKNNTGWWVETADGGYLKNQFFNDGNATYFLAPTGYMVTGWQRLSQGWYYFDSSGAMQRGWQFLNGKWYYLEPQSGKMLTGWQKLNGAWYFLEPSGAMQIGWVYDGNAWYYTNASGVMQTGWQQINNLWYFFQPNGVMAQNEWINGYWFSASGAWTYPYRAEWKSNRGGRWYEDSTGWCPKNTTVKIDGLLYTFDKNGYEVSSIPDVKLEAPKKLTAVYSPIISNKGVRGQISMHWFRDDAADIDEVNILFPDGRIHITAGYGGGTLGISPDYPGGVYTVKVRSKDYEPLDYSDWAIVTVTVPEGSSETPIDVPDPNKEGDNNSNTPSVPENNPNTPVSKPEEHVPSPILHTHSWDNGVVTKAATCEQEGLITYTCSCGEARVEVLPKTEHNFKPVWGESYEEVTPAYDEVITEGRWIKTEPYVVCGGCEEEFATVDDWWEHCCYYWSIDVYGHGHYVITDRYWSDEPYVIHYDAAYGYVHTLEGYQCTVCGKMKDAEK